MFDLAAPSVDRTATESLTETASAPERRPRRRLAAALTLLGATVATLLGMQSSASAYSLAYNWGRPGYTTTPFTYAASTGYGGGTVTVPYRTVYESSYYGASWQYVCVTANLETASGATFWTDYSSSKHCAWISPSATSVVVNGADFTNLLGMNMAIYSVNIDVTWQLSSGAYIGERIYDYNATGDYRCSTAYCGVGSTTWGGGAYVTFTR